MVPFVCIVKSMFSEEYIVPEEQRLEKKKRTGTELAFFLHFTTKVQDLTPQNIAHFLCPSVAVVLHK